VPGEVAVEQRFGSGEGEHAGVAELLQFECGDLGDGDGLGEVQFSAVGVERLLVKAVDVLQQPG
jgi:hypothetical protein